MPSDGGSLRNTAPRPCPAPGHPQGHGARQLPPHGAERAQGAACAGAARAGEGGRRCPVPGARAGAGACWQGTLPPSQPVTSSFAHSAPAHPRTIPSFPSGPAAGDATATRQLPGLAAPAQARDPRLGRAATPPSSPPPGRAPARACSRGAVLGLQPGQAEAGAAVRGPLGSGDCDRAPAPGTEPWAHAERPRGSPAPCCAWGCAPGHGGEQSAIAAAPPTTRCPCSWPPGAPQGPCCEGPWASGTCICATARGSLTPSRPCLSEGGPPTSGSGGAPGSWVPDSGAAAPQIE